MGIAIGTFPEYNIDEKWIKMHLLSDEIPMTAWNKLVSRQLIIENSLFFREGILHEDEVWRFFLSKCVKSIAFCFNPTYKYYTSISNSLTHKIDKTSSFCSLMKIVEECTKNIDINFVSIEGSFILKLMSKSRRKRLWPDIEDKAKAKIAVKKAADGIRKSHKTSFVMKYQLWRMFWPEYLCDILHIRKVGSAIIDDNVIKQLKEILS